MDFCFKWIVDQKQTFDAKTSKTCWDTLNIHTSQDVKNMWKPNKGKMVLGKVVFKHHKLVSFQCKQFSSENQKDKEEDLT